MNNKFLHITAMVECCIYSDSKFIEKNLHNADMQDDDGYPTEVALEIIERWGFYNHNELFKFMESIWWTPSFGWHETETDNGIEYQLSTGGWSGNESIIYALEHNKNHVWHCCWVQSRRGGHYIFEVDKDKPK